MVILPCPVFCVYSMAFLHAHTLIPFFKHFTVVFLQVLPSLLVLDEDLLASVLAFSSRNQEGGVFSCHVLLGHKGER